MKCAVAIVLALFGLSVATPVGHAPLAPLLLLSAVSVSSSVINHGVTLPVVTSIIRPVVLVSKVVQPPIITSPIYSSLGHGWSGLGWGKSW